MTTKFRPALPILEKKYGPFNFAMFMRVARNELELTQVAMAKKLKIAPGTLCDIEKGRQTVSVKLAAKIAKMAGLSEPQAVRLVLQEQVDRAKIKLQVEVKSA